MEFSVSNAVLKNESYSLSPNSYYDYHHVGDRGMNSQSNVEVYDPNTDVIFYTQLNKDAVGCWNSKKDYTPQNQGLVDKDPETLIFPNDLKIDREGNLWVLSDRMSQFMYGTMKSGWNYRILKGNTKNLIKGTPCDSKLEENGSDGSAEGSCSFFCFPLYLTIFFCFLLFTSLILLFISYKEWLW